MKRYPTTVTCTTDLVACPQCGKIHAVRFYDADYLCLDGMLDLTVEQMLSHLILCPCGLCFFGNSPNRAYQYLQQNNQYNAILQSTQEVVDKKIAVFELLSEESQDMMRIRRCFDCMQYKKAEANIHSLLSKWNEIEHATPIEDKVTAFSHNTRAAIWELEIYADLLRQIGHFDEAKTYIAKIRETQSHRLTQNETNYFQTELHLIHADITSRY